MNNQSISASSAYKLQPTSLDSLKSSPLVFKFGKQQLCHPCRLLYSFWSICLWWPRGAWHNTTDGALIRKVSMGLTISTTETSPTPATPYSETGMVLDAVYSWLVVSYSWLCFTPKMLWLTSSATDTTTLKDSFLAISTRKKSSKTKSIWNIVIMDLEYSFGSCMFHSLCSRFIRSELWRHTENNLTLKSWLINLKRLSMFEIFG